MIVIAWRVIAWYPDPRDPYRLARAICQSADLAYADALALADAWASLLARDRRIVVEVMEVG